MDLTREEKESIKDCILKIFWTKKEVITFLDDNGCNHVEVKHLKHYEALVKSKIIDLMFRHLTSMPDSGTSQFKSMINNLSKWEHFNSHYFEKLKKLNKDVALEAIEEIQKLRKYELTIEQAEIKEIEKAQHTPQLSAKELESDFMPLMQHRVSEERRGHELKRLIHEIIKMENLDLIKAPKLANDVIESIISYNNMHYRLIGMWHGKPAVNSSIQRLIQELEENQDTKCIIISIIGFSNKLIKKLEENKNTRVIFIDGIDITEVLVGKIKFPNMLSAKTKAAENNGILYYDALNDKSRLNK